MSSLWSGGQTRGEAHAGDVAGWLGLLYGLRADLETGVTPELFMQLAIDPALALLPRTMDTAEARAMLIAICLQESKLEKRRQGGDGPARSYAQFEKGGVRGILTHRLSAGKLKNICGALDIPATVSGIHQAMEFNDVLAAVCARLLLWTVPAHLPTADEPEEGWRQYLEAWRPGKPHPSTWPEHYARAWLIVNGDS